MNISKEYISTQGKREYKVSTKKYDLIKEYIPSFSKKYENKLVINKDEIKYIGDNVIEKEKKWLTSLNISEKNKTAADIVNESPKSYYQKVILNYTTDHEKTENAVNKWKIFYSDGDNVYLIADNYISKDYNGSGDITDKRLKALNNECFKNFESNNPNMKAVAYLMDISEKVWGVSKESMQIML